MIEANSEVLATGDLETIAVHLVRRADAAQPSSPVRHQAEQALRALTRALVARRDDDDDPFTLTVDTIAEQITLTGMIAARHRQASTTEGRWGLRAYLENNYPDYDDALAADAQPESVRAAHSAVARYVQGGIARSADGAAQMSDTNG